MESSDFILETTGLTKEFGGFVAVSGVDLAVRRGSIHALIGPNGAGKTTCFNLLTKFLTATRGRISYKGRDITAMQPADVARLGLVRSFQISAVFPDMTVLENVRIALQRRKRGDSLDFWRSEKVLAGLNDEARTLVEAVSLTTFVEARAGDLSYGRKRALEIATTLALDPEMLLLDEPMAGLSGAERRELARLLRRLRAGGMGIVLVEHDVEAILALADRVAVLDDGVLIALGTPGQVRHDPAVIAAYLGVDESDAEVTELVSDR